MLEVGAGNGYFSEYLRRDFDLTSLDFSSQMLSMNPLPEDQKVVGDAEDLPYPDDAFDVVFYGNLLHHLEDPGIAVRDEASRRLTRRPHRAQLHQPAHVRVRPAQHVRLLPRRHLRRLSAPVGRPCVALHRPRAAVYDPRDPLG